MNKLLIGMFGLLLSASSMAENLYRGTVVKVIDGDTIKIQSTVFPSEANPIYLRFVDVYAPEINRSLCNTESQLGTQAADYLKSIVQPDSEIEFTFEHWDFYSGRFNGKLYVKGKDVISNMLDLGYLSKIHDKGQWCD